VIIAIQQPEHLPWIGFFNKMAQVDLYVYLDNVQFKRRYFENRNRISGTDGIHWITVPVQTKGKFTQLIRDVAIDNSWNWRQKYLGTLSHAYAKAPYSQKVRDIVSPVIEAPCDILLDLNLKLIERLRNYFAITTPTICATELAVDEFSGSDLILQICLKLKASVYVSGPDGRNYLDITAFQKKGVRVIFHDFQHPVYPRQGLAFCSHLSVVDAIAFLGEKTKALVKDCYVIA